MIGEFFGHYWVTGLSNPLCGARLGCDRRTYDPSVIPGLSAKVRLSSPSKQFMQWLDWDSHLPPEADARNQTSTNEIVDTASREAEPLRHFAYAIHQSCLTTRHLFWCPPGYLNSRNRCRRFEL